MGLDIGTILKGKQEVKKFLSNHTKFGTLINQVKEKGFIEGQEVSIAIRYPDGTEYKAGLKVKEEDLKLLNMIKNI